MGAYFSIFGIRNVPADNALSVIKACEHPMGDPIELFRCPSGHSLILCDTIPADAKGLAQGFAKELRTPVILLNFADDVVWSYELYTDSGLADEYSSRPNYWRQDADALRLAGNAQIVSKVWGAVSVDQIDRYLTNKDLIAEPEWGARAYSDDSAVMGDAWQMCDFMSRLGLEYPVDEEGELIAQPIALLTIASLRGLEQKESIRRASAQLDEILKRTQSQE